MIEIGQTYTTVRKNYYKALGLTTIGQQVTISKVCVNGFGWSKDVTWNGVTGEWCVITQKDIDNGLMRLI